MLITPYKQEILDGLEDKLKNNIVAFSCLLEKSETPSAETVKAIAAFQEGRNFDLYYLQSILASVGNNKNDEWFLPEEIWAARHTPVHKQLNYMHDEKNIIGVITDSIVLNSNGEYIIDDSAVPYIKDIATQAVIWTHWDDKKVEQKIAKIIASIEEKKLFVSMEALFRKFDYMIVKGEVQTLIPRVEQTAFLTKHLRYYGGSGEFDGGRLYRVPREFTFSGKGIVTDPANPRSIISDHIFAEETNKTIAETIMAVEEDMKKEIAELKSALADANKAIASFKEQETQKVSAEVEELKAQVIALKALAEESKDKMDKMEKECAEKMDMKEKEACAKVEEAEAKVSAMLAEKIIAERISKLIAANVTEEKAKEVVKTFASVNDEMFEQIASLYSVKAEVHKETVENVDDAVAKAQAAVTPPKVENVEPPAEDGLLALSQSIASKLNFIKNKGNK